MSDIETDIAKPRAYRAHYQDVGARSSPRGLTPWSAEVLLWMMAKRLIASEVLGTNDLIATWLPDCIEWRRCRD